MGTEASADLVTRVERLEAYSKSNEIQFKKLDKALETVKSQEAKVESLTERVSEIEEGGPRKNIVKKSFVLNDAYEEKSISNVED